MYQTIIVFIIMFDIIVGTWSVDCILSWFNKDIPLICDLIIALFVDEFSVPIAIVGSILKSFGIF